MTTVSLPHQAVVDHYRERLDANRWPLQALADAAHWDVPLVGRVSACLLAAAVQQSCPELLRDGVVVAHDYGRIVADYYTGFSQAQPGAGAMSIELTWVPADAPHRKVFLGSYSAPESCPIDERLWDSLAEILAGAEQKLRDSQAALADQDQKAFTQHLKEMVDQMKDWPAWKVELAQQAGLGVPCSP